MRKTIYYQRDAADPVLEDSLVLDIVRGYASSAKLRWWHIGASAAVFITAPETSM